MRKRGSCLYCKLDHDISATYLTDWYREDNIKIKLGKTRVWSRLDSIPNIAVCAQNCCFVFGRFRVKITFIECQLWNFIKAGRFLPRWTIYSVYVYTCIRTWLVSLCRSWTSIVTTWGRRSTWGFMETSCGKWRTSQTMRLWSPAARTRQLLS
jgi:hypothetical protein